MFFHKHGVVLPNQIKSRFEIKNIMREVLVFTTKCTMLFSLSTRKSSCVNTRIYRPPRKKYWLCFSVLGWGGGVTPFLTRGVTTWGGGEPSPVWAGGYTSPVLARGYPRTGYLPTRDWGTPCLGLGYPHLGLGYPLKGPGTRHLRKNLGLVYPLEGTWDKWLEVLWDEDGVAPRSGQTDACENSTFPSYYVRGR